MKKHEFRWTKLSDREEAIKLNKGSKSRALNEKKTEKKTKKGKGGSRMYDLGQFTDVQ